MTTTTTPWNKDMFTKFQCEMGLIMNIKTGKNDDMVGKYTLDAMAQMTDDEFIAMNERITKATGLDQ